jgi:hypothetical protein
VHPTYVYGTRLTYRPHSARPRSLYYSRSWLPGPRSALGCESLLSKSCTCTVPTRTALYRYPTGPPRVIIDHSQGFDSRRDRSLKPGTPAHRSPLSACSRPPPSLRAGPLCCVLGTCVGVPLTVSVTPLTCIRSHHPAGHPFTYSPYPVTRLLSSLPCSTCQSLLLPA